jgi:hypothetical protein
LLQRKKLLEEIPLGEEVATISPTGVALAGVRRSTVVVRRESISLNPKLWALILRQLHEVAAVLAFTDRNQRIIAIPKPLFLDKGGCGIWTSIPCTIVFFLRGNIWVESGYSSQSTKSQRELHRAWRVFTVHFL